MTGSSAAGNSQPVHINMLTSHVTQHGGTRLINRPEGVIMSWEAPANMDLAETSRYMGVNDLRHDVTTDMATGDTTSVAHAHFTHEEYEAYRNSPQGRVMELPPMPPEKQGNTIGTLTYMPSPSPVRAEYANPPEIPPEDIEDPEAPPGERTSQRLEELKAEREAINQRLINPDAADEYVRFNDLHSSADGLISNIKGTPGTAGDYAAQGSRAILGFVKDAFLGIGELAYEGGKLAVSAQQNITNPAAMYGQVLDAQILAENVRLGNVTTGTMANGAMSTATSVGNAIIAPVAKPWANGQYVEAVTRGVIEVATLPLTILKSGKLAKSADALTDAATANKATNAADAAADANKAADAGDAAKAPEPQGPNGNGGKIKATPKMKKHKPKCFKPGKALKDKYKDDPKKMEKEFYKQLKAQEDGINKMTVGEYTKNRGILNDLTAKHGHEKAREILTQGGKAQEAARKQLSKKIQNSIEESLAKNKIYGKEAEKIAAEQTQKQMSQLAALHDPDLIAGGNDTISRVGNKNVNSSLGSQWAKDGRVDGMDKAAGKAMAESGPDTPMNVELERCKD